MDPETVRDRHAAIVSASGPWTAHNIQVAPGVFTLGDGPAPGADQNIRRVTQVVADLAGLPFNRMRLLDLGCLEGLYGMEFALRGASVVGIEGRETSLAKASFARDILRLENLDLRLGDVRTVSPEREGKFDVILCLGILYHLEEPALFDFVMTLGRMTTRLLVIDTHIALRPKAVVRWAGADWHGRKYVEHAAGSTPEEVRGRLLASLDNPTSFWLTEASLLKLLTRAGFTSIYLCKAPPQPAKARDRITVAAVRGSPCEVLSTPWPNRLPRDDFPELVARPAPTWRGIAHDLLHKAGLRGAARRVFRGRGDQ